MKEIMFSLRMTEEEAEKYRKFAEERKTTLANLIRNALDSAIENPSLLNPTKDKTDLDTLILALEISAKERMEKEKKVEQEIFSQFNILDQKVNLLIKKLKIPKKEIEKIEKGFNGGLVFE